MARAIRDILELPGLPHSGTAGANDVTPLVPAEPADATGRGQVSSARLAEVAQVAQVSVAKPADVARVAPVARPEIPGVTARPAAATNVQQPQVAIEDARRAPEEVRLVKPNRATRTPTATAAAIHVANSDTVRSPRRSRCATRRHSLPRPRSRAPR